MMSISSILPASSTAAPLVLCYGPRVKDKVQATFALSSLVNKFVRTLNSSSLRYRGLRSVSTTGSVYSVTSPNFRLPSAGVVVTSLTLFLLVLPILVLQERKLVWSSDSFGSQPSGAKRTLLLHRSEKSAGAAIHAATAPPPSFSCAVSRFRMSFTRKIKVPSLDFITTLFPRYKMAGEALIFIPWIARRHAAAATAGQVTTALPPITPLPS